MTAPGGATVPADPLVRLAPALRAAARRFGTPLAVTDVSTLEVAVTELREAFPDPWLRAFSVKANDVTGVVARLADLGLAANVVSRGEWAIARRAGLPNSRITLEGIGKTDDDLRAAVRAAAAGEPPRWVAIESLDEASALARLAGIVPAGRALDVLFRLNPGVAPETSRMLAVGAATSKFGMAADEVTAAIDRIAEAPALVPRGVHVHVGSQLQAVDAWRDGTRRALALLALVRGTRPSFDTLDVGGGFPVFGPGEPAPTPGRFARELEALLLEMPEDRRPARLAVEPGRFLVARAGWLVGRVLHVREREGRQVVVDVGMAELIRPALYGAEHAVVALTSLGRDIDPPADPPPDPLADPLADPPADHPANPPAGAPGGPRPAESSRESASSLTPTRIEGPICELTDHLGEHRLPALRRGDLVAIRDTGAYAASMASTYNGRPRPPQVVVEPDGRARLIRPRGRTSGLG
jgi:diaminopimelate decarboxylase